MPTLLILHNVKENYQQVIGAFTSVELATKLRDHIYNTMHEDIAKPWHGMLMIVDIPGDLPAYTVPGLPNLLRPLGV